MTGRGIIAEVCGVSNTYNVGVYDSSGYIESALVYCTLIIRNTWDSGSSSWINRTVTAFDLDPSCVGKFTIPIKRVEYSSGSLTYSCWYSYGYPNNWSQIFMAHPTLSGSTSFSWMVMAIGDIYVAGMFDGSASVASNSGYVTGPAYKTTSSPNRVAVEFIGMDATLVGSVSVTPTAPLVNSCSSLSGTSPLTYINAAQTWVDTSFTAADTLSYSGNNVVILEAFVLNPTTSTPTLSQSVTLVGTKTTTLSQSAAVVPASVALPNVTSIKIQERAIVPIHQPLKVEGKPEYAAKMSDVYTIKGICSDSQRQVIEALDDGTPQVLRFNLSQTLSVFTEFIVTDVKIIEVAGFSMDYYHYEITMFKVA